LKKLIDQIDSNKIESITGLDATFLYADTNTSPMHVGGVAVIEGSLKFETFKQTIASRIHQIPKLRKKLVEVPFSIDHPYWVDDPNFDLDLHLTHIALPKPGDWKQLRKLASRIFSKPLNKDKPLWSFYFVEGLDNLSQVEKGSVAIISKIHHVVIDGVAGAGILGIIFDFDPNIKKLPEPRPFRPVPLPNEFEMALKSSVSFLQDPLKFPRIMSSLLSSTLKAGFLSRAQHNAELPVGPFTAPKTPINGIISAKRKWNTSILSLARVKALKNIMGCTLNDIILAICASALRKYLSEKKKLPKKPLVAMVPISTRDRGDSDMSGNKLSAMLVQLATNIEDPLERLEKICQNTQRGKTYQGALGAKNLSNLAEAVPFGIANQAARLYSRFNLSKLHKPVFNVVITNVPGPTIPLYLQGHKLHSIMGMAPIIDGMGLIITVLSYHETITISPTSDAVSMPDLNVFSDMILESANELEEIILKQEKQIKKKQAAIEASKRSEKPFTQKYFEFVRKYLKAHPDFIKKPVGLYQFNIENGESTYHWQLNLRAAPGSVRKGKSRNPDVVLSLEEKHLKKFASGNLNVATAFIQGRLKIEGESDIAMKLASILKQMPPFN